VLSGALENFISSYLLLSHNVIALASHIAIILTFTLQSLPLSLPLSLNPSLYPSIPICIYQEFNLFRGSAFGLSHNIQQLSFFRPWIRAPGVSNVYRVGSSTRPGNGVPLVMVGARLAAEAVVRDLDLDLDK